MGYKIAMAPLPRDRFDALDGTAVRVLHVSAYLPDLNLWFVNTEEPSRVAFVRLNAPHARWEEVPTP